jgi:hypothetical protein
MEILDGDDVRLSSRGKYAERDIVQVSKGDVLLLSMMTCFSLLLFLCESLLKYLHISF